MTLDEGLLFTGSSSDATIGVQAVALGDIDGDGYADLALGSDPRSSRPGVYLLYGGPSLASMSLDPSSISAAGGLYLDGPQQLGAIGDFDGDGLDDWLTKGVEWGATIVMGSGARYPTPVEIETLPDGGSTRITLAGVPLATNRTRIVAIGDVDGDGRDDLALIAPEDTDSASSSMTVLLGRPAPTPVSIDLMLEPDSHRSRLRFPVEFDGTSYVWSSFYGAVRSGGDLNGDGRVDLSFVVPDSSTMRDQENVVFGNSGPARAVLKLVELPDSQRIVIDGSTLTKQSVGDLNADGFVSVYGALATIRPTQAENLSVIALSTSSIRVSWEPSEAGTLAAGYEIRHQGRVIGRTAGTNFTETG